MPLKRAESRFARRAVRVGLVFESSRPDQWEGTNPNHPGSPKEDDPAGSCPDSPQSRAGQQRTAA